MQSIEEKKFTVSGDRVFFTLQGEGQTIGKPVIFLRLHFCNLHCSWCDTKYTWDKNSPMFESEPIKWDYQELLKEITKYPCKHLVITGGEPLLHKKQIDEFLDLIPDWQVEIETNGTIFPSDKMATRGVQFNVSPKLGNSENEVNLRYRPDVLVIMNTFENTTFKFVVTSEKDMKEIQWMIDDCSLDNDKIILMPEGVTQEDIHDHALEVVDICKQKGWRLVPRLQIMLWGNKRAV